MKEPFQFNLEVALEAILYLISKGKPLTRYYLLKMIYYADRKHLFDYGAPITGDSFYAMEHGPVPSRAYDLVKVVTGEENRFIDQNVQQNAIETFGYNAENQRLFQKRQPNLDYLSPSALESLDWAFNHLQNKSFGEIKEETHKHSGYRNLDVNDQMSYWDIILDSDNAEALREYLEDS